MNQKVVRISRPQWDEWPQLANSESGDSRTRIREPGDGNSSKKAIYKHECIKLTSICSKYRT